MFSNSEFIDASRKFVCVRLESYESEEHQKMVRSFLDGRFENTAFCLLAPDGEERLSRTGRAPWMAFRTRGGPRGRGGDTEVKSKISEMEKVADAYPAKGDAGKPVVQDFHSFKQSLNVASGDQRLLLFIAAPEKRQEALEKALRPIFGDEAVVGRFHCDFLSEDADEKWSDVVDGASSEDGLFIIQSDEFGQAGKVLKQLPPDAQAAEVTAALLKANREFATQEERKVYKDHVAKGRREGVEFETVMPYGEDRDGDGVIDHRGGRGRGPGGEGRPRRRPPGQNPGE
ncbi:MAG: hypothetical protein ACR2RV_20485 [Verrucomicrobiales bacterium]